MLPRLALALRRGGPAPSVPTPDDMLGFEGGRGSKRTHTCYYAASSRTWNALFSAYVAYETGGRDSKQHGWVQRFHTGTLPTGGDAA